MPLANWRNKALLIAALSLVMVFGLNVNNRSHAMTAGEILKKVDDNEYLGSARFKATMVIVSSGREISKTMVALVQGDKSLTEFTNARDKGTKYLKIGDELWMYFPNAEDVVKISGHLLRQGMMGSDYSYQDALESRKLTTLYDVKIVGEEKVNGRDAYVLELTAKPGAEVSYAKRYFENVAEVLSKGQSRFSRIIKCKNRSGFGYVQQPGVQSR
jgi:outer membrane lipoprotein-sorting protein